MRGLSSALCSVLLLQMTEPALAQDTTAGSTPSREEVGDWAIECFDDAETECQLYQRILTQDPLVVAMVVSFYPISDGGFRAQIALPLGVDLSRRPELRLDEEDGIPLAWSRCIQTGCLVEGDFKAQLMKRVKEAKKVSLAVYTPNGGVLSIPLYLDGFEKAVARLSTAAENIEYDSLPATETPP